MFKNLFDYSYQRNFVGAIGFYLAYLIMTMMGAAIVASVIGIATGNQDNFQFGLRIGSIIAILVSVGLSGLILKSKNLFNNFGYVLLFLLSGVLAFLVGGLGGLIPVAFLSTRRST